VYILTNAAVERKWIYLLLNVDTGIPSQIPSTALICVIPCIFSYDCNHSTNKCTIILYYIYIYLAYMFRPYPVIIRALRYTKGFKMCLKYLQYRRTF
jgi:hypothetical protein